MTSDTVLQVVTSTDRRGAESFAVDLESVLRHRGWTIRTMALAPGRNPELEIPTLGPTTFGLGTLRSLRREAARSTVVIAHGSSTLPACALAMTGLRRPFVYRNIGDPSYWSTGFGRRARTAFFISRARAVAALTNDAQQSLHDRYRIPTAKITTIPTGVSSVRHLPPTTAERTAARLEFGVGLDDFVAVTIGALSHEKGVDLAIDAIARDGIVDHLLLAGDGPERTALETRAHNVAPRRVQFLGNCRDVSPVYAAADVVVLPSRTEGLPAVLIEAGMRQLPVVATDVGYVRDIVLDGQTGVVVDVEDPVALHAGISRVVTLANAGEQAREHCIARFDLEVVATGWEHLLQRVTADQGHGFS